MQQSASLTSPWPPAHAGLVAILAVLAALILAVALPSPLRPDGYATTMRASQVKPPDCRTEVPLFAVTIVEPWLPRVSDEKRAVLAFANPTDSSGSTNTTLATQEQVGSTFGLAYDPYRNHLYAAAYFRHALALGPGGTGSIYRIHLSTGDVEQWANLDGGPDHSSSSNSSQGHWVGKAALGDIELAQDGTSLFVTNLYDRRIYRLSVPDGEVLGSFPHGASGEAWASNARPFGLGFREGWLYHGLVDSREDPTLPGTLASYVYRSRPDGSETTLVAQASLDYARFPTWKPWVDMPYDRYIARAPQNSQPMLTDIEFRPSGELLIGLRDRVAEMVLVMDHPWDIITGDILPTEWDGNTWQPIVDPEWYQDETKLGDEAALGTLATIPGRDSLVSSATSVDENIRHPAGILWFDNTTGSITGRETIIDHLMFGQDWVQGLGDIESLCVPPPTATPSPTPASTRSATPTPVPSNTPTTRLLPSPIFLPIALYESCEEVKVHADVVLVLDLSTSMQRQMRSGRTKLEWAQDAAQAFLDLLDFTPNEQAGRDQVAIVGFNDTAWIQQALTPDERQLRDAIKDLSKRMAEGTRLDLALDWGVQALQAPNRAPDNTPVIILLTDGLPNRVPTPVPSGAQEDTVLARARRAKRLGYRIYTIGFGRPDAPDLADRINPDLLRAVASEPSMFYQTPDGEELAEIYSEIAYSIGCPPGRFWGRGP